MVYGLVCMHFLLDWVLQPRPIARRKASSWPWMLGHLGIIFCGMFAWNLIAGAGPLHFPLVYTLAHGFQDKVLWRFYEWKRGPYSEEFLTHNKYAEDPLWYDMIALDQVLHLFVMFWIWGV